MDLYIVVVIITTAVIQSIFGVGVLLFGTPLLLLAGYDFVNALTVLLPISLVINLFQIVQGKTQIDLIFYRKLLIYTIPPIVLSLAFTVKMQINVSLFIGLFLLFISLKSLSSTVEKTIVSLFKFDRSYFILQGIIHGLTNLGGSLLTSKVFSMNIGKAEKRATISLSYFTFALFQIVTLVSLGKLTEFNFNYVFVGVVVFAMTDYFVYNKISNKKYDNLFAVFLFLSGCMLLYMGLV
jgi:uncharacterized protein